MMHVRCLVEGQVMGLDLPGLPRVGELLDHIWKGRYQGAWVVSSIEWGIGQVTLHLARPSEKSSGVEGKVELMGVKEAARAMALTPRILMELARAGELESVKVGKSVLFEPAALSRFVARHRVEGKGMDRYVNSVLAQVEDLELNQRWDVLERALETSTQLGSHAHGGE